MKKKLGYVVIFIGYMLVTFFGLGPILFADGGKYERMITLVIVLCIYGILTFLTYLLKKKK